MNDRSRLYLRPLREGAGAGFPPPWTVREFDALDCEDIRAGAAWDELTWAAREGDWIARVESPTRGGFPPLRASYVVHRGRVIELPLILPTNLVIHPTTGVEEDAVTTWESAATAADLFAILDPDPPAITDETVKLYVRRVSPRDGTLGDLAWRCVWRASIAVARAVEDRVPSYFASRTAPYVETLDAWSRKPASRDGDREAEGAALELALLCREETQETHATSEICAMGARCFAGARCVNNTIDAGRQYVPESRTYEYGQRNVFSAVADALLADVVRNAVADDLYLSIAAYGEVRHAG